MKNARSFETKLRLKIVGGVDGTRRLPCDEKTPTYEDGIRPDVPADPLATALVRASAAGQWGVVAALAAELQARRLAGSNVVPLPVKRRAR